MKSRVRASITIAAALSIAGCGANGGLEAQPAGPSASPVDEQGLGLDFMLEFAPVAEQYGSYGSQQLIDERRAVLIYWYGELETEPSRLIEEYRSQGLHIDVVQPDHDPAALAAEASRLTSTWPELISSVSPESDFSGLIVAVVQNAAGDQGGPTERAERLGVQSSFPLRFVEADTGPL